MYLLRIYIVIHWLLLCTPQFLVQPAPGSKDQKVVFFEGDENHW